MSEFDPQTNLSQINTPEDETQVKAETKIGRRKTIKQAAAEKEAKIPNQKDRNKTDKLDKDSKSYNNDITSTEALDKPNSIIEDYPKESQKDNAIKKLEGRGVPLEIQNKLGIKWITKKEACDDFYNFDKFSVSPWGGLLIPYTSSTKTDRFYGQLYNFYPTKEIEAQETDYYKEKGTKLRKYISPKGLTSDECRFYDPYKILNPDNTDKRIFLATEDTFGVILAAIIGYRCISSRMGVTIITNEEIKTIKRNKPFVKEMVDNLGYTFPWFPDNDWVNKPDVWGATIKSAVYLNLKIGLFPITEEKIGLDEYIKQGHELRELTNHIYELDEFIDEHSKHVKFKIKANSTKFAALAEHNKVRQSAGNLINIYPELVHVLIKPYHLIDDYQMMAKALKDNFRGKIRLNELTQSIEFPEHKNISIEDLLPTLAENLEITFKSGVSEDKVVNYLVFLAKENKYHPMEDYLLKVAKEYSNEPVETLGNLAEKYFGTNNPLHDQILKKCLFLSVIARVLNPGCFIKAMLVLTGIQSAGKTSFFRAILPNENWAISDMKDVESKDGKMLTAKSVIMEWGEISRILYEGKREEVKNFQTRTTDQYRPPYARDIIVKPRRFIVVGTTNEQDILMDKYDHTRFKIVPIAKTWSIPIQQVKEDRDRVWGVLANWWLNLSAQEKEDCLKYSEVEEIASLDESDNYRVTTSYESRIAEYLSNAIKSNREFVQTADVMDSLGIPIVDKHAAKNINRYLTTSGWLNKRKRVNPHATGSVSVYMNPDYRPNS